VVGNVDILMSWGKAVDERWQDVEFQCRGKHVLIYVDWHVMTLLGQVFHA
jgi:hypothetical protein